MSCTLVCAELGPLKLGKAKAVKNSGYNSASLGVRCYSVLKTCNEP